LSLLIQSGPSIRSAHGPLWVKRTFRVGASLSGGWGGFHGLTNTPA
jgi:hypothetical protein